MSTHVCAAPFCGHLVSSRLLMCPHHWAMVPRALQLRLYSAWNGGRPEMDYLEVRAAAIAAVGHLQQQAAAAAPDPEVL